MDCDLDVLTLLLLDPCLTADEAAREAAARTYTASAAYFRPTLSSCPHEIHDLVVEPYTF